MQFFVLPAYLRLPAGPAESGTLVGAAELLQAPCLGSSMADLLQKNCGSLTFSSSVLKGSSVQIQMFPQRHKPVAPPRALKQSGFQSVFLSYNLLALIRNKPSPHARTGAPLYLRGALLASARQRARLPHRSPAAAITPATMSLCSPAESAAMQCPVPPVA